MAAGQPWLAAVVPDLPGAAAGDEGFEVASGPDGMDLSGFSVTDGEGAFPLPSLVLGPGERAWFTGNASAWTAHQGPPAAPWEGKTTGRFQLGNDGDGLQLLDSAGRVVDAFAWGDGSVAGMVEPVSFTSPGLVYRRLPDPGGGLRDCDCSDDWRTPRIHRIGESELDAPAFEVGRLTLYSSPDSSFGVLRDLVSSARERLHLHVYELRSAALVDALVAAKAASPGLDLQVFVEGAPVGMDAWDRREAADALRRVEEAGGSAWLAGNGRYAYHHLKALVADDAVAVQSENWVESGVPEDPTTGNRGWGVVVHDAEAADWFASWMAADRSAWDTKRFDLAAFDPLFTPPPRFAPRSGEYGPVVPATALEGRFRVTPVVSPDHTADPARDPVARLASGARDRLWAEQLDLRLTARNDLGWSGEDALAGALRTAAQSGADVRALAAAPFSPDDAANRDALAALAEDGVRGAFLERDGILILHNKGLVADDAVVIGSMNGNHHSRSGNREVSVILEGPGVADFYAGLFLADWDGQEAPRDASVIRDDLAALPAAPWPTLLALAFVGMARRRRA